MSRHTAICSRCNWVHFFVSFESAWVAMSTYNTYQEERDPAGQRSTWDDYQHCFNCGASFQLMEEAIPEDTKHLMGSTIQPVLDEETLP